MLLDHCYEFGLLLQPSGLKKKFFEEGDPPPPPGDLFCLALDLPLGKYGQNILHVPGYEHFIPTKFCKHPLSNSVVKAGYVFLYICMH